MARKKKHAEHENHERWVVSYADFMTLLFATFTAMFAISSADKDKFAKAAISLRNALATNVPTEVKEIGLNGTALEKIDRPGFQALNVPSRSSRSQGARRLDSSVSSGQSDAVTVVDETHVIPDTLDMRPKETPKGFIPGEDEQPPEWIVGEGHGGWAPQLQEELLELVRRDHLDQEIEVRRDPRGLVVILGEAVFFEPGKVFIKDESLHQLEKIMTLLKAQGLPMVVEGHTDDRPLTNSPYQSNFELSVTRASRLWEFMIGHYGFDPVMLSAAGYGPYRPIASNNNELSRRRNRRVEIVIKAPGGDL